MRVADYIYSASPLPALLSFFSPPTSRFLYSSSLCWVCQSLCHQGAESFEYNTHSFKHHLHEIKKVKMRLSTVVSSLLCFSTALGATLHQHVIKRSTSDIWSVFSSILTIGRLTM